MASPGNRKTPCFLAVCTVQHVTPRELVPDGTTRWNATGQYYEATLLVNRAFRALRQNETITLRYISYDPNALCCANGSPLWPRLKAGDIALFPLKPASDPNAWSLVAEEGQQILVPALTNEWRTPAGSRIHRGPSSFTNWPTPSRAATWPASKEPRAISPHSTKSRRRSDPCWSPCSEATMINGCRPQPHSCNLQASAAAPAKAFRQSPTGHSLKEPPATTRIA